MLLNTIVQFLFQVPLGTAQILFVVVWLTSSISHMTSGQKLISPYKSTIRGLFSLLEKRLAWFTACILPKQSYHLLHCTLDFLLNLIYIFCAFANRAPLFSTHMGINQFIDQFRNPVTAKRAEDIHRWKAMGSESWFPGREETMVSKKMSLIFIWMIGTI